jgi:hypothetical protein
VQLDKSIGLMVFHNKITETWSLTSPGLLNYKFYFSREAVDNVRDEIFFEDLEFLLQCS